MKTLNIIITAAMLMLTAFMAGCKNDIELDTHNVHPRLTLNGYIDADSATNTLYVSATDMQMPTYVNDATVKVTVNGQLRETITSTQDNRGDYILHGKLNPGDAVRIDVTTADGSQHAYVEEVVPHPIDKLENLTCRLVKDKRVISKYGSIGNEDMYNINVDITDNATQTNYYRIALKLYTSSLLTYRHWSEDHITQQMTYKDSYFSNDLYLADDPVIMEGKVLKPSSDLDIASDSNIPNTYGVFSDVMINGKTNTLSIFESSRWLKDEENSECGFINDPHSNSYGSCIQNSCDMQVVLFAYTASAYYYLKAMNFKNSIYYDDNSDITGPLKLPSNVKGGVGLVGFCTSKALALHLYGPYTTPGIGIK